LVSGIACNNNYTAVTYDAWWLCYREFLPLLAILVSDLSGSFMLFTFATGSLKGISEPSFIRKFYVENPLPYTPFRLLPDNSKVLIASFIGKC